MQNGACSRPRVSEAENGPRSPGWQAPAGAQAPGDAATAPSHTDRARQPVRACLGGQGDTQDPEEVVVWSVETRDACLSQEHLRQQEGQVKARRRAPLKETSHLGKCLQNLASPPISDLLFTARESLAST